MSRNEHNIGVTSLVAGSYPSFIKYMGSKSKIIDFVIEGINEVYRGGAICDLFAGSGSLSGAIGQQCAVQSNDIQTYSSVLSQTYSNAYIYHGMPSAEELLEKASAIVKANRRGIGSVCNYLDVKTVEEFVAVEEQQRKLILRSFRRDWHLFVKNYSGTWWSAEQCLWIDALREVAEDYKETPSYYPILSCLMFAMAYASQGTGHYAQYRDATSEHSLSDILIYRKRAVSAYFLRKYQEVLDWLPRKRPSLNHVTTALDFRDCLASFVGGTVYADPPYCFVHYSRFYHALETLVLYDYPDLQIKKGVLVKGRYRAERHQSPFCIKTQVKSAFNDLFVGVKSSNSTLALSYSNTGMISISEVVTLAAEIFGARTTIDVLTTDHQHMTLGRLKDRHRDVQECLILIK